MLRLSKLTDYATVILAAMAREPGARFTAAGLAERTGVGQATVSKLLKRLARAGLLASYRGARGGYRLSRSPAAVSAVEIVDLIEGRVALTECAQDGCRCELEGTCGVSHQWQRINRAIRQALDEITLADLAAPEPVGLPRMALRQAMIEPAQVDQ